MSNITSHILTSPAQAQQTMHTAAVTSAAAAPVDPLLSEPLDPETVVGLCERQINDVDAQIKDLMLRQRSRQSQTTEIGKLTTAIGQYANGIDDADKAAAKAKIDAAFENAKTQFPEGSDTYKQLDEAQKGFDANVDKKAGDADQCMTAAEMKSLGDSVSGVLQDINTARELDMMDLQRAMGSRQQIFTCFSNILAKMEQTSMAIINNQK